MAKRFMAFVMVLLIGIGAMLSGVAEVIVEAEAVPQAFMDEAARSFEAFCEIQNQNGLFVFAPYVPGPKEQTVNYTPIEGLSVSALYLPQYGEQPMYIVTSQSTEAFQNNHMWMFMLCFVQAMEPALTEAVAYELVQELLFSLEEVAEGANVARIQYGRWLLTLTTLDQGDGPTLFIMPADIPQTEPINGCTARIDNTYSRFLSILKMLEFPVADEPLKTSDVDVGMQQMWEILPQVWWLEIYLGDIFLGYGVNVDEASPYYAVVRELERYMLIAADPTVNSERADMLLEQLEAGLAAADAGPERSTSLEYEIYAISMVVKDRQRALLMISPFGN